MTFDPWTLALQAINFVALVYLLQRFFYRPVTEVLEKRKAEVAHLHQDEEAVTAREQAVARQAEDLHKQVDAEKTRALEEAHRVVASEREEARQAARSERDALLEQGRRRLEAERTAVADELHARTVALATELAGRIVTELGAPDGADRLLERALGRLEAYEVSEREDLVDGMDGHPLVVRTWPELADETREATRARLHTLLGDGVRVEFEADEDLVAGAELHFPTTEIAASIRAALDATREELDA